MQGRIAAETVRKAFVYFAKSVIVSLSFLLATSWSVHFTAAGHIVDLLTESFLFVYRAEPCGMSSSIATWACTSFLKEMNSRLSF